MKITVHVQESASQPVAIRFQRFRRRQGDLVLERHLPVLLAEALTRPALLRFPLCLRQRTLPE